MRQNYGLYVFLIIVFVVFTVGGAIYLLIHTGNEINMQEVMTNNKRAGSLVLKAFCLFIVAVVLLLLFDPILEQFPAGKFVLFRGSYMPSVERFRLIFNMPRIILGVAAFIAATAYTILSLRIKTTTGGVILMVVEGIIIASFIIFMLYMYALSKGPFR